MNLLGKIFTVLIFVMSLVFMSFSVAVYATHKNWKEALERPETEVKPGMPLGLKYQLENARKLNEALAAEKAKLEQELAAEKVAKTQALAKLSEEKIKWEKDLKDLETERAQLLVQDKEKSAALATAQQNLSNLTKEVASLRQSIRDTQDDRDKQFATVVKLTDDIHQKQGEITRQSERVQALSATVGRMTQVLQRNGLTEFDLDRTPPAMQGEVLAVNRDDRLEVSLGSDDGLRVGNTLEVYRGAKYLGRVEVMTTDTDRAVGKILAGYKKGVIQKGDRVVTRFNSSDVASRSKAN